MIYEFIGLPGSGKTTLAKQIKQRSEANTIILRDDLQRRSLFLLASSASKYRRFGALGDLVGKIIKTMAVKSRLSLCDYDRLEKSIRNTVCPRMLERYYTLLHDNDGLFLQLQEIKNLNSEIYQHRLKVISEIAYLDSFINEEDLVVLDEGLLQRVLASEVYLKHNNVTRLSHKYWKLSNADFFVFLDISPELAYERYLLRESQLIIAGKDDPQEYFEKLYLELKNQVSFIPADKVIILQHGSPSEVLDKLLGHIDSGQVKHSFTSP